MAPAAMVVPRVAQDGAPAQPGNPVMFDAALRHDWLVGGANLACRQWRGVQSSSTNVTSMFT